jgi:hypothetical protein
MHLQTSVALASWFIASVIMGFSAIEGSFSKPSQFNLAQQFPNSCFIHRGSGRIETETAMPSANT